MPLSVGEKLGPYEILAQIGAGGMGEVYRARDTKLKREVAVKVLPEAFARDPERMSRFQREAEVLASLNHPNIATIHGVEDRALVMELVEGNSPKGPLPFDEAWKIASQIAAALEYAHERGIMHRDLKPANIMITPDGVVKLLDFGLAKAFSNQREPSASPENSPTLTLGATEVGVILGTAAYMAPEQAKGKKVDKRADIWAFGIVLWELLTGERLFKAEDAGDTLALVLTKQPDYDRVPPIARRLLRECLEKDPRQRLRDIGDARRLLKDESPASASVAEPPPPPPPVRLPWAIASAFALVAAALGLILWAPWRAVPDPPKVVRFQITPQEKLTQALASISPDGSKLAYEAEGADGVARVWVRSLDSLESRALPGTEGVPIAPLFWSYDSRFVGFSAPGKLKKVDVTGGPPQTLCDIPAVVMGASWNRDGVVLFGLSGSGGASIQRVPSAGGAPSDVIAADAARRQGFPVFLPDGRHFLYFADVRSGGNSGIYLGSLDSKPTEQNPKRLLATTAGAAFVPYPDGKTGAILFDREGTVMAQPFDLRALATAGEAVPVAEQVGSYQGYAFFSASENGTLAYRNGPFSGRSDQLTWLDRQGKPLGTVGGLNVYTRVRLSPDGTRFAEVHTEGDNVDIWLRPVSSGGDTRFTFDPAPDDYPVWSPDGSRIAFTSARNSSASDLYLHASNGSGGDELLFKSDHAKIPTDWSRDGRFLLYDDPDPKSRRDLWVLPMDTKDRKPIPFLQTPFNELGGRFSPDGRWIAYQSDESGRREIYVRQFPAPPGGGGKWMVSQGGGILPAWRSDGKELFYQSPQSEVMAVPVAANGAAFQSGPPKILFGRGFGAGNWEVTGDGQKFLVPRAAALEAAQSRYTIVLNLLSLLKK